MCVVYFSDSFFFFFHAEQFIGKIGKVHTLVKQAVNQDVLSQMCPSKKDLTKVF